MSFPRPPHDPLPRPPRGSRWLGLAGLAAVWCLVASPATAATLSGCGTIATDTTWTSSNVYTLAGCNLVVGAGATLSVEPGTHVKVGGTGSAIIVDGRIEAVGSASQPIAFTSLTDDSRGGDTNADGSATAPASGDWYGFLFRSGSSGRLEHFFVGYAGSGVFNNAAALWNRAQVDVDQAAVELRDGEIAFGKRKGVYLNGAGLTPVLERLVVRDNEREAGNTSAQNIGYAIYQTTPTCSRATRS